jgi:hypothetical protein
MKPQSASTAKKSAMTKASVRACGICVSGKSRRTRRMTAHRKASVTRKLVVLPMTAEHVTVPPTAILFVTSTERRVSLLRLLLRLAAGIRA